jgi:large subunit ribosomal protein L25
MNVEVIAQTRSTKGKGPARRLRQEAMVPAVLYGPKTEPVSLAVNAKVLEKLLRDMGEESKLLNLTVQSGGADEVRQVLIREVQVHPVRRRFLHVDFYEVPLDHAIIVNVPIEVLGEAVSVGVKKGGTLNLIQRTLSVRCLPGSIPEKVQIDVSSLDVNEGIHVGDLVGQVPFDLVDDRTMAIVNIEAPEGAAKDEASE